MDGGENQILYRQQWRERFASVTQVASPKTPEESLVVEAPVEPLVVEPVSSTPDVPEELESTQEQAVGNDVPASASVRRRKRVQTEETPDA